MRTFAGAFLLLAALPTDERGAAPVPAADPEATRLLADARAARARWDSFPGFTADLEVNLDGQVARGTVRVNAKGKVALDLADPAAQAWAKPMLASVVGHRLDGGDGAQTPCAFLDENTTHPLGRALRVLNDEFHSSYRIRDRQVLVVNRQMKDSRFSIAVLENVQNEEKQFLPACFVVNSWNLKADSLRSSETHHQTWRRVGRFDLPLATIVVTAEAGKSQARSLKLTNHQLLR
jgi:hypothetical protein